MIGFRVAAFALKVKHLGDSLPAKDMVAAAHALLEAESVKDLHERFEANVCIGPAAQDPEQRPVALGHKDTIADAVMIVGPANCTRGPPGMGR